MKKILVTGAAGFIGSHLVEHLLDCGIRPNQIRLLIPKGESLKNLPNKKFEIIRGDIRNIEDVKKSVKDIEVIYHLAALIVKKEYTKKDYFDVNVYGTKNLIDYVDKIKLKKFIFFSSVAIYGLPICIGDMKNISENSPKKPCEVYGKSKLKAEEFLINSKLPYAIIRPTSVYGPRDHSSFPNLVKAIKDHYFFIVGNGKNKLDYVFVKDLVRAAKLAEKNKKRVADYIIGGGAKSLNEIASDICQKTNSWIIPFHFPKNIALFISYFTSILGLPFYPGRVNAMTSNFYFDLNKARKEIGYKPEINFKESINLIANE
jgi:nucleoside-diphosphate-sugar epimerase